MKTYSYADADVYDYKNLTEADKSKVDLLLSVRERVLTEETVDYYLDDKDFGEKMRDIVKELLIPFVSYLKEEIYHMSVDYTVETIDNYPKDYNNNNDK